MIIKYNDTLETIGTNMKTNMQIKKVQSELADYLGLETESDSVALNMQSKYEISVQILKGASRRDISLQLIKEGIIKSAFVFNYYTRFETDRSFLYGEYQLSPSMTVQEILERIQK